MYFFAEEMMHASPRKRLADKTRSPSKSQFNKVVNESPAHPRIPDPNLNQNPNQRESPASDNGNNGNQRPPSPVVRPPQRIPRRNNTGSKILVNILRALLARTLFIVHSIGTIWITADVRKENGIWTFALVSVSILIEGSHTVIMRAGDERKWFSPSIMLYIMATVPPIWLLETTMCEWRTQTHTKQLEGKLHLQLIEQLCLVVLIVGRWLLPKGQISREQLSQILLAYLAMSSDIVEFFDVFKESEVYTDSQLQVVVLSAWTLSMMQFPFVLTMSRARKMRIAINEEVYVPSKKNVKWTHVFYDIDIWAIMLSNSLQDVPFLLVRIYLMFHFGLLTYTMAFFTCKNALIIALQTYRAVVLFNDRYLHPIPEGGPSALEAAAKDMYVKRRHRSRNRQQQNSPGNNHGQRVDKKETMRLDVGLNNNSNPQTTPRRHSQPRRPSGTPGPVQNYGSISQGSAGHHQTTPNHTRSPHRRSTGYRGAPKTYDDD